MGLAARNDVVRGTAFLFPKEEKSETVFLIYVTDYRFLAIFVRINLYIKMMKERAEEVKMQEKKSVEDLIEQATQSLMATMIRVNLKKFR